MRVASATAVFDGHGNETDISMPLTLNCRSDVTSRSTFKHDEEKRMEKYIQGPTMLPSKQAVP